MLTLQHFYSLSTPVPSILQLDFLLEAICVCFQCNKFDIINQHELRGICVYACLKGWFYASSQKMEKKICLQSKE